MKVTVDIVNAFERDGTGGNPAGVVLDADRLGAADKLAIAREVGLSETAFVSDSKIADFKLDFFTPTRQIAHCGHATIAAFCRLRQLGRIARDETSKETVDGVRQIFMRGDEAYMEQRAPKYFAPDTVAPDASVARILHSLGIAEDALVPGQPPLVCWTGNRFLLVPVADVSVLQKLRPDLPAIHRLSDELDLIGYYVFARTAGPFVATTRMFGPRYGIVEEAGTGMAAGPLACWLYDHGGLKKERLVFEQGACMNPPSPSRLVVDLELQSGKIQRLFAGGRAQVRETRTVSWS
jgi:PhzF family phenazine biosynthesis protein